MTIVEALLKAEADKELLEAADKVRGRRMTRALAPPPAALLPLL